MKGIGRYYRLPEIGEIFRVDVIFIQGDIWDVQESVLKFEFLIALIFLGQDTLTCDG